MCELKERGALCVTNIFWRVMCKEMYGATTNSHKLVPFSGGQTAMDEEKRTKLIILKKEIYMRIKLAFWAALVLSVQFPGSSRTTAQDYELKVVATNLKNPTGIFAEDRKSVYFTQLPTPGVAGGENKVSVLNPKNGKVKDISVGEPEPTGLAGNYCGDIYWTCKSAGVINTTRGRKVKTIIRDLDKPTGIAAFPFEEVLVFTEVPTPAVSGADGGSNAVLLAHTPSDIETLNMGDPEPTDVAIAFNGDVYWTCSSAGVILRLSGGNVEVLIGGLDRPTGIALDHFGNLYFTEVPTPGVSGADGGTNAVYKYELSSGAMTLINFGDPEPTDVSALRNGTIYWTCTSAGVIVQATPK